MDKKIFIVLLCCFLCVGTLFSQTSSIRGFVYKKKNGEPVIFTNVFLKGTSYGATTDVNGFFNINKIPPGKYTLLVTFLGYDSLSMPVKLKKGEIITKKLFLTESSVNLDMVEISGESEALKTETRTSIIKVSPKQIKQLPTIGGQADIAQYMQVLPGVVFTGDQGGQLYIRGGSPIQNKVMLDGMIIYNPFHSIGLFSVFETDIIRNADIYTGGFNAQHGGRISSIMDITTRDGNKNRIAGKVGANTFGANVLLEGPLKKMADKKNGSSSSFIVSFKNSYLKESSEIFYNYIDTAGLPFNYTDIYSKLSFNTANGSKINFFGFNFDDVVNYKALSDFNWTARGAGSNFIVIPGNSPALIEANFAYSSYDMEMIEKGFPPRNSSINGFNGGLNFTYFFGKDEVKYGIEFIGYNTSFKYFNTANAIIEQNSNTTEVAFYTKYKWTLGKFLIEPGFRLQYFASLSSASPEPRLACKYNVTGNFRLKFAGGFYSQNLISSRSNKDVVNLFYGFLSGPENLPNEFDGEEITHKLQKAKDIIFGVEYEPIKKLTINLEPYYKDFSQLTNINKDKILKDIEENADQPGKYTKDFIVETGEAYGIDFIAKYDFRRYYFWAVYSLGHVTRYDGEKEYYPYYDRRHNVNLLGTVVLGKDLNWELSARWNLGSGFPFARTLGVYEKLNFDGFNYNPIVDNGTLKFIYEDENNGRLPYYHRLDISLKRTFFIGDYTELEVFTGVTNAYDRENVFYFDRVSFERVNQLPMMPSFGATLRF